MCRVTEGIRAKCDVGIFGNALIKYVVFKRGLVEFCNSLKPLPCSQREVNENGKYSERCWLSTDSTLQGLFEGVILLKPPPRKTILE